MRNQASSTVILGAAAVSTLFVVMAWWVTVPAALTPSNVLTVAGLLGLLGWVAKAAYENGQPAHGVALLLYDTEHARLRGDLEDKARGPRRSATGRP
jgi:hypothetical protein